MMDPSGGGWRRGDGRWGDFQVFTALHFDSFFVFVLHVLWFPFCFCNALHFDFLFVFVLHVAARRGSRCRQPWHWGRRPLLLQWAWYCPPLILIIDDKDNKQWLLVTMKRWKKFHPGVAMSPSQQEKKLPPDHILYWGILHVDIQSLLGMNIFTIYGFWTGKSGWTG